MTDPGLLAAPAPYFCYNALLSICSQNATETPTAWGRALAVDACRVT